MPIGFTKKSYGIKGEVKIQIKDLYSGVVVANSFLFLDIEGDRVPFYIERIRNHQGTLVKFRNINDPSAALLVSGREAYIESHRDIKSAPTTEVEHLRNLLIGCSLMDVVNGDLGVVVDVLEYPSQTILKVKGDEKTYLIPFVEAYIEHFDLEGKRMETSLPDGLLELFE